MFKFKMNSMFAVFVAALSMLASDLANSEPLEISQFPLFQSASFPPMNMLVMGRDHSLFYQAYNDASDLTGNGVPDVGYKPLEIDYYGLFDSFKCYSYGSGRFTPTAVAGANKTCSSGWSGDFLNWITTSRIDALRKVLYGGKRSTDTETATVLERSYIPQDAHSWGKEYQSIDRDGYDIRNYTPLGLPGTGRYHLFANTSLTGTPDRPRMRVLRDTGFRVWEWVAIERPVAGRRCLNGGSGPDCTSDAAGMDDYTVRVAVCDNSGSLPLEPNCQRYASGVYKPVGLLQEFGETGRMHFGLITGSYLNNMSGGVLRRAMSNISDEFNDTTGQFTDVEGIVSTIDSLKIVGLQSDHSYHPGWSGAWLTTRTMNEGEFPDWGNPVAEMVYESLRYFSGAEDPTPAFVPPLTGGMESVTSRLGDNLELPVAEWDDPFSTRPYCTAGAQLIISNTNISFDGNYIPGSSFSAFSGDLSGFNATALGDEIWGLEVGGPRQHFIGQSGANNDGAPTVKTVSSLGNIRGLSPQEPTREGTYYTASAARFGAFQDLRDDLEQIQNVETFSVALASQLPRIEFPVDGRIVSLVPFGKSVNGCENTRPDRDRFQPMAQIVDFFVEEWANTDSSNMDASVNGGRPFARFRINFEDVEQAADHDMDGIARYEIGVNADGSLSVSLTPEYYAGCIKMNIGYVISGVESDFNDPLIAGATVRGPADGMYLEVRGDPNAGENMAYYLNTPPGLPPGACATIPVAPQYTAACTTAPGLPPADMGSTVSRTFYPAGDAAATVLENPLWWAAKYGNTANEGMAAGETPDNYFLVTNAATLADQLSDAFTRILDLAATTGLVTSSTRLESESLIYSAEFDSADWSGDLVAFRSDGEAGGWSAGANLDSRVAPRNILTWDGDAGVQFEFSALPQSVIDRILGPAPAGTDASELIEYLVGDRDGEVSNGGVFRNRSSVLGDIINSRPVFSGPSNEGWNRLDDDYAEYIDCEKQDPRKVDASGTCVPQRYSTVLIGANDGMLHGFDAETGDELFAYVPFSLHPNLHEIADPNYSHRFFVDGQITVGDAKINGSWSTVAVGGFGAGGKGIFAIDITRPQSVNDGNILWEISAEDEPELGYTFGEPIITRLGGGSGTWVAIFGNGYNSASRRARLYVVELETGNILHRVDLGDAGGNGLSGVAGVRDVDTRLALDRVYAGDLEGTIWRVDFNGGNTPTVTWNTGLINLPGNRAITTTPQLAAHPSGGIMVYVGTGKLIESSDRLDTSLQQFWAVRDLNQRINNISSGMAELTLAEAGDGSRSISGSEGVTEKGWFIDLQVDDPLGERVLARARVLFGTLIFPTYQPVEDPCVPGGIQRLYVLDAISGDGGLPGGNAAIPIGEGAPISAPIAIKAPRRTDHSGVIDFPGHPDPDDPQDPPVPPTDSGAGEIDGWCSVFGIPPLAAGVEFIELGTICEGRQVWRQVR